MPSASDPLSAAATSVIGRETQLAHLCEAADRATRGGPGHAVWLHGAAGLGKTELVDALVTHVGPRHARGACRGGSRGPFAPFVEALTPWLPRLLAGADGPRRGPTLARLWPGCWPGAVTLEPTSEAARLKHVLAEAVESLAKAGGLVLVLEDWHLADAASNELAGLLVQHCERLPLLLVFTARPHAAGVPGWAAAAEPIGLPPLDDEALARLVAGAWQARSTAEVPTDLLQAVSEFSGGNPLLAGQFLAHELLVRRIPQAAEPQPVFAPADVDGLVVARLAGKRTAAHELALLLAIYGREATPAFLARASGWPVAEVEETLGGLVEARLAVHGAAGYRLAHTRIGEALLGLAPPNAHMRWHAAVALALAAEVAEPGGLPLPHLTALAAHALAGAPVLTPGESEAAITYTLEAGLRCATLHANEAAEHFLDAALAALRLDGRANRREARMQGLVALGDVRRVTGRFDAAKEAYADALVLAESLDDQARRARILTSLAKVHQGQDDVGGALALAHEALAIADAVGAHSDGARAALTAARLAYYQGDVTIAVTLVEGALSRARTAEDPVRQAEALAFTGHLGLAHGDGNPAAALAALHESISLLAGVSDQAGLAQSYTLLGDAQAECGEWAQACTSFKLARWICQELGSRADEGIAILNLAAAALELGEAAEARDHAAEALALADGLANGFQGVIAEVLLAAARARLGETVGTFEALTGALGRMEALDNRYLEGVVWPWAATTLLDLGRVEAAVAAVARGRPHAHGAASRKLDDLERLARTAGGIE